MYAQLGDIIFQGLKGFQTFERRRASNLARIGRIANKAILQQIGVGLEEITVTIRLMSDFTDVLADMEQITDYLQNGTELNLVAGDGRFYGVFVIEEQRSSQINTTPNGTVTHAELELKLVEVAQTEPTEAQQQQAAAQALGISDNEPEVFSEVVDTTSPEAEAAQQFGAITSLNTVTISEIESIEVNPAIVAPTSDRLASTAVAQEQQAGALEQLLATTDSLVNKTTALRAELVNAQTTYAALQIAANNRDINSLTSLRGDLEVLNAALRQKGAQLTLTNLLRL